MLSPRGTLVLAGMDVRRTNHPGLHVLFHGPHLLYRFRVV